MMSIIKSVSCLIVISLITAIPVATMPAKTEILQNVTPQALALEKQVGLLSEASDLVKNSSGFLEEGFGILTAGLFGSAETKPEKTTKEETTTITDEIKSQVTSLATLFGGMGAKIFRKDALLMLLSQLKDINELKKIIEELETNILPELLTEKQKKQINQLKKLLRNPVIKGILKAVGQKSALDQTVQESLKKYSDVAQKLGKKAEKRMTQHIRWNWQLKNYEASLEKLKKLDPRKALVTFRKWATEQQLRRLYKKHPELQALTEPIEKFTQKTKFLQEGYNALTKKEKTNE